MWGPLALSAVICFECWEDTQMWLKIKLRHKKQQMVTLQEKPSMEIQLLINKLCRLENNGL